MSENGTWRPLPRPGREGPPHLPARRVASSLSRRRETAQLLAWLISAAAAAFCLAMTLTYLTSPAGRPPAGPMLDPGRPVERLAPACAETMQGCPAYADRPAPGTFPEAAATH